MNTRDQLSIREIIRLCEVGEQLAARGYGWYCSDPDNVPGMACESLIIKIGENVARISAETIAVHPLIPWSQIKRMRDLLAHHYEGTDYDAVWDTLVVDLPEIKSYLMAIV